MRVSKKYLVFYVVDQAHGQFREEDPNSKLLNIMRLYSKESFNISYCRTTQR